MLTPSQLSTLKSTILGDQALAALVPAGADGAVEIANAMNALAAPVFFVWRTSVPLTEVMLNGFDWTRVDNLSVGKARIWEWMFQSGNINPSKPNIRAGIDATWTGTQADLAVRAVVYGHCQRQATRLEKLFATGFGSTVLDGVGPATMAYEGSISYQDVLDALAS